MSILMPAIVKEIKYPKCAIEDEGLSGVTVICESHIAVHTFPRRSFAEVDVSSCKDFDEKVVAQIIESSFGADIGDRQMVKRGRLANTKTELK